MDIQRELALALGRLIDVIQFCDEEQYVLSSLHPAVMHALSVLGRLPPQGGDASPRSG